MFMPNYSRNNVILVRYPFSGVPGAKIRPAIIVSAPHLSRDVFVVPLTSRITSLLPGEFVLADRVTAGLNVPTAVKRGLYTIHDSLVITHIGTLVQQDIDQLDEALRKWLALL